MTEENTDEDSSYEEYLEYLEYLDIDTSSSYIHNAVYDIVIELRSYTEENQIPLMDKLNYIDLFSYIDDIVKNS